VLIAADVRAHICREPVDMRKSIDGLSYLVEPLLAQSPVSGNVRVRRPGSLESQMSILGSHRLRALVQAP
jgi:IS66 Orf2 like protein